MTDDSKRRLNLDNCPFGVAWSIVAGLQDLEVPKGVQEPNAGKGKRFTLFSLTLLSKSSNAIWTPFLWKEVRLPSKNLHCFFRALKRIPEVGNFVRKIYFLNFFEGDVSVEYLPDGSVDMKSMLPKLSDQVTTEGSLALKPFDDLLFPNLQFSNLSIPTIQLHRVRCSTARARILDILPNLESLEFGEDVIFPFVCRLAQEVRPLIGLTANLKELKMNFINQADIHLVSPINAMWLLCLPKLKSADLYVFVKKSDVKFFEFHQTAFVIGKSNVTSLGLRLDSDHTPKEGSLEMILECFISTTKKLNDCSINLEGKAFMELEFLENSISTLESLKIKGAVLNYSKISGFAIFSKIKVLSVDLKTLSHFLAGLKRSFKTSTKPEVLPPALEKLNLTSNCFFSEGHWMSWSRSFQELPRPKEIFPEFQLGSLILWVSLPISLIEISSYRRYNFYRDPKSLSDKEKEAFEFAREHLRRACSKKKLQFVLLDALLSDDAH